MLGQPSAMCVCWLALVSYLNFLSFYLLYHRISYTPSPAKLAENGITAYRLSANSTGKLVFICNLSGIFITSHHFCLLSFYSQPFSFLLHFSCNCLKTKMMFEFQNSGTKTKLHLINAQLLSYQFRNNSLSYFQNLLLISVP